MSTSASAPRRGRLRVLLGAAPGVGKTCLMLEEGGRLRDEGVDVVLALVETHGRTATAARTAGLETIPRREVEHRGLALTEMDLDAVLARHPRVALVDELAHTNAPGGAHERRWQDVEALLAAGIDVITTVNVQHIESLADTVATITGVSQRERIPDAVVRAADEIEVVDVTPQALRERLAAGAVYPAERIDTALSHYFRIGNLTALRELALLWLADEVDSALARYRSDHGIRDRWDARERVVVAITGGPESETLLRRAARIASRTAGGELLAIHVTATDGLSRSTATRLPGLAQLTTELGGTFHQVAGDDVTETLLTFARSVNATQLVIGVSRRGAVSRLLGRPAVGPSLVRDGSEIDVHLVNHAHAGGRWTLPTHRRVLPRRRIWAGLLLGVLGAMPLTALLAATRSPDAIATEVLAYQMLVILATLVGGLWPAVIVSILSGLLLDFVFIQPLYQITIAQPTHLVALLLALVNGLLVAMIVDQAAARARVARRSAAEAELLASLTGAMLVSDDPVGTALARTREALGAEAVRIVADGRVVASSPESEGDGKAAARGAAAASAPIGETARLDVHGDPLDAPARRLIVAVADLLHVELEREELTVKARESDAIADADRVRRALLAAVGHDLRRPLAAARASVDGLGDPAITAPEDRAALLETATTALSGLDELVTNLLDVSRLQSGTLAVVLAPVDIDAELLRALDELQLGPDRVRLALDPALPPASADAPLLRRILVNLLANADRHAPAGTTILVRTGAFGGSVQVRVADAGPGVPESELDRIFQPFQRLGDTDNTTGLGLGLALSRGFAVGMGGSLDAEPTPGGGLTMVLDLPASDGRIGA